MTDHETYPAPYQVPATARTVSPRAKAIIAIAAGVVALAVGTISLSTQISVNATRTEYTEKYRDYMDAYTELGSAKTEAKVVFIELTQVEDPRQPALIADLERLDAQIEPGELVDKLPGSEQGDRSAVDAHSAELDELIDEFEGDTAALTAAVEAVRAAESL